MPNEHGTDRRLVAYRLPIELAVKLERYAKGKGLTINDVW